jgi:uncharacterized protein YndB with AHSA1/START domain
VTPHPRQQSARLATESFDTYRENAMLTAILIVIVVAIAAVLALAMMKPDVFRMQREGSLQAPPDKVFALINDFKNWAAWSPWDKKDPAMKRSYGANTVGVGGHYAWEGNKDVGIGSMTITESMPPSTIVLDLVFVKPFPAQHIVTFTLTPEGGGTRVTWAMHGPSNFMSKLMQVFMDLDKMVGKDFEAGLASLKAAAEQS